MTIDELDKKELIRIIKALISSNWKICGSVPSLKYRFNNIILDDITGSSTLHEIGEKFIERILRLDYPDRSKQNDSQRTD